MLRLDLQSVVGITEKNSWSQAINLRLDGGGRNGLVIRIVNKNEEQGMVDLSSIGSSVLTKIQDSSEGWIDSVIKEVSELEENMFSVMIVAYTSVENRLKVWGNGGGKAYLLRADKLAELVGLDNQEKMIEGEIKTNDRLMLWVGDEKSIFSGTEVVRFLSEGMNAKELLAREIHGGRNAKDVAILIGIAEEEKKIPEIRINRWSEEPKKFNLIIGGGLLIGIVILALIGTVYKVRKNTIIEFEAKRNEVNSLIAEARTTVESNPERAKMLLTQARDVMGGYLQETKSESYRLEGEKILESLKTEEQSLLRVSGAQLGTTIELKILNQDLESKSLVTDGEGNVYFEDQNAEEIIGVNLKDKSKISVKLEEGRKIQKLAVGKGKYVGVVSEGVMESARDTQKIVIEKDELWGEIGQLGLFGNNIYMLDLGNSEIWKYSATDNGYVERKRWLAAGIVLDLTKVADWVVDGDIWLLTSSGKLERYSRGAPSKFELTGFPAVGDNNRFVEPVALGIAEEKIYVLERGASRVVTFDMNGKYLGQMVAEEFAKASDLVVYEGKGYVLIDNVIKEFDTN